MAEGLYQFCAWDFVCNIAAISNIINAPLSTVNELRVLSRTGVVPLNIDKFTVA